MNADLFGGCLIILKKDWGAFLELCAQDIKFCDFLALCFC